jgi:hypothetical protein
MAPRKPVVEHIDLDEQETQEEAPVETSEDGTVWLEASTGQFHVEIGSPAYERLVADGATRIDDPTN